VFSKDWRVRIDDMLEAIDRIRRYTAGLDERSFCNDDRTVDAVVRNLEIIGEAARKIPADIAQRYPSIPWHRMAEVRNVLVHEYHSVDSAIVWNTIHHDLPPLIGPLKEVLRRGD
jgi:uncharacterized protein with HEPN domain